MLRHPAATSSRAAFLALAIVLTLVPAAEAQRRRATTADPERSWLEECERWGDRDRASVCHEEEFTLSARRGALVVNARPNGGITVVGSNRRDIRLVARMQAQAPGESAARGILDDIEIITDGEIRAEGPRTGRNEGWSVSFVLEVPREMDLDLASTNGGITIEGVAGDLQLATTNGGLVLNAVAGNVRGRTDNGGVTVTLEGDRWVGEGLDLQTTNGGVRLRVPDRYNARLETGTVNGGLDFDFPVTVRGRISRRLSTDLGEGGAPIRVVTTNGGVSVTRR